MLKQNKIMKKFIINLIIFLLLSGNSIFSASTNSSLLLMRIKNTTNIIWEIWDNCDTHQFWYENWGGGITNFEWGYFNNRNCLKFTCKADWGLIRTDWFFYKENWENYSGLTMDVLCDNPTGTRPLKIEIYRSNDTKIEAIETSAGLSNNWKRIIWNFSSASDYSKASKLFIIPQLEAGYNNITFYIDNICVISNSQYKQWDIMDKPHNWRYATNSDAVKWNDAAGWMGALIPITHNNTSSSNPAGAIYMEWRTNVHPANYAKVEAGGLNENWSGYSKIKVDIYCTATNEIKIGFWDGTNSIETSGKKVSSINTWQTIIYDFPSGNFNWRHLNAIYFLVITNPGDWSGKIYIDNIYRGF